MQGTNLEVCLAERQSNGTLGADFRASLVGCERYDVAGRKYIIIANCTRFGRNATAYLGLDNYCITSLTWNVNPEATSDAVDVEVFARDQESQNEAFEAMEIVLGIESRSPGKTKGERTGMSGPMRVEVLLRPIDAQPRSEKDKKLVVLKVLPPGETFPYHTIRGREYYPIAAALSKNVSVFHGEKWWIPKIEFFSGAATSRVMHFGPGTKKEVGWARVEGFHKKLTATEAQSLYTWDPETKSPYKAPDFDPDDDRNPYWHCLHGPSSYAPTAAAFRVAGDEIGASIHLGQAKRLAALGAFDIEDLEDAAGVGEEAEEGSECPKASASSPAPATYEGDLISPDAAKPLGVAFPFGISFGKAPSTIH